MTKPRERLAEKHGIVGAISVDVPDEWYDVVDDMLIELKKQPLWHERCIHQIKEKFLELRVYADHAIESDPICQQIIFEAEKKCRIIKPYRRPPRGTTSYP